MSTATPSPELPAFDLRCRDAEWIDRPATLDEFAAVAPVTDPYAGVAELLIRDAIARSGSELGELLAGRVMLSCEYPCFGIPLGVHELDRLELDDWHIREQVDVELLDPGLDGRLGHSVAAQFRRGLLAVAGVLPLLASPVQAHARAPDPVTPPAPQVTDPSELPPSQPQAQSDSASELGGSQAPAQPVDTRPQAREGLLGNKPWLPVLDQRVNLKLKNGQEFEGRLLAQSSTELALVRSRDGTVVSVPKREIASARLTVPRDDAKTIKTIHGLYGGGASMVAIGSLGVVFGVIFLASSYPSLGLVFALPGAGFVAGGAAMLAAGVKKRKALEEAWGDEGGIPLTARVRMQPTLSAGRRGGQVGLILRF